MAKEFRDPQGAYELTLPTEWEYSLRKSSIAFFDAKNGSGAINISVMRPPRQTNATDPVQIALNFVPKELCNKVSFEESHTIGPTAFTEYETERDAWRLWVICMEQKALIVSYNCPIEFREADKGVVDDIVRSLRPGRGGTN